MSEPLSSVDAAWLRMENPTNLMMVTGMLVFEAPLDHHRVRSLLHKRLLSFDRFRQRVVEARFGIGPPRWVDDDHFDLDAHLHRVALPAPGGKAELEELVGDLMSTPLDLRKPLWQIHLVTGYQGGSVFLARLHHCIADGIALIQLLLSLTDGSPRSGRAAQARPLRPSDSARAPLGALASVLANPLRLLELAQAGFNVADTLQRLALLPPDPRTVLKGKLGVSKRAAWSDVVSLEAIKAAGARHGATVNDILIVAVAGALRAYLAERGESVDQLEIRAAVPVNLRPVERGLDLGNSFGLVFVPLPISIRDRRGRLAELKVRMRPDQGFVGGDRQLRCVDRDRGRAARAPPSRDRVLRQQGECRVDQRARAARAALPGRQPDRQLHVLGADVGPPRPRRQHPELRRRRDGRRCRRRRPGARPGPHRQRFRAGAEGLARSFGASGAEEDPLLRLAKLSRAGASRRTSILRWSACER